MKQSVRFVLALAVLLFGAALAPFTGLPDVGYRWQQFIGAYEPELTGVLTVDFESGRPGSAFNFTGSEFTGGANATVLIAGVVLGTVPVDSAGLVQFQITSDGLPPGVYWVVLFTSETNRAAVPITIDPNDTFHDPTGTLFSFPAPEVIIHLPHINRYLMSP